MRRARALPLTLTWRQAAPHPPCHLAPGSGGQTRSRTAEAAGPRACHSRGQRGCTYPLPWTALCLLTGNTGTAVVNRLCHVTRGLEGRRATWSRAKAGMAAPSRQSPKPGVRAPQQRAVAPTGPQSVTLMMTNHRGLRDHVGPRFMPHGTGAKGQPAHHRMAVVTPTVAQRRRATPHRHAPCGPCSRLRDCERPFAR